MRPEEVRLVFANVAHGRGVKVRNDESNLITPIRPPQPVLHTAQPAVSILTAS